MLVCAHGNVTEYCETNGYDIVATWTGKVSEYKGVIRVIVTDSDITEAEYYFLKGEFLAKGYELISTKYKDDKLMVGYLAYANERRKQSRRARVRFSDEAVIQKIRELSASGKSLRAIRDTEGVCHPDGRKLSLSTIQNCIKKKE